MLTAIVDPETSNLMAPATVLARLKLPESDLAEVTEQVEEASGLIARYLGFRPEYTTWRETFPETINDRLYLGARPVWSIQSLVGLDETVAAAETYLLDRGPYGESSVRRAIGYGWGVYGDFPAWRSLWPVSAEVWSIDYTAGWWLEEMTGEPPAGVERFPAELRGDFLRVVRWVRAEEVRDGSVRRMKESDAEVEFFGPQDAAADPVTGIPMSCLGALALYRRAV